MKQIQNLHKDISTYIRAHIWSQWDGLVHFLRIEVQRL